jgi:hypothetical protein
MIRLLFLLGLALAVALGVRSLLQRWQARLRGQPLSGRMVDNYANGRPRSERYVEDGMLHGPWITWDEQGNKVAEGHYVRGIVHGLEVDYSPGGVRKREVNWVNGRRHGLAREYGAAGQVVRELTYVHAEDDKPRHDGAPTDSELRETPKD